MKTASARPQLSNRLLSLVSLTDLALLHPHLLPVDLPIRMSLETANKPIKNVFFLEDGIASVVAKGPRDKNIEAGIIGDEGMTGLPVVLGDDRSPNDTFVQIAGRAQQMPAKALREAMRASPTLHGLLLRFAQAFSVQLGSTALANGRANTFERLARWILMAHDRLRRNQLPLTHEFLGVMLGVRRAGVTVAIQGLEGEGLIKATRGQIVVRDRSGLVKLADGYYGVAEQELRRLFKGMASGTEKAPLPK